MRVFVRCLAGLIVCAAFFTARGAAVPLVSAGDEWLIHQGTNAPATNWKTAADESLDLTQWRSAKGGFGFADNTTETADCQTILSGMLNQYKTLYYRKTFSPPAGVSTNEHIMLAMDFDDGFIAWLDGSYLTNIYAPGAPTEPAYTASATANHEASRGNSSPQPRMTFDLGLVGSRLGDGPHVLAVMGLNSSSGSSDFIQIADLYLDNPPAPPSNSLSGTLAADATLYASNSPYAITGSLIIPTNVTLTIQPGTTLHLYAGANVTIASGGTLLAEGTAESPLLFTRPGTNAAAWGHILVQGALNSPETRMAYVYLEGNGSSPCIEVDAGTVYFDHLTFGTTSRQYLVLDDSSFVVTDCHFPAPTSSFEPIHGVGRIKSGGRGIIQNCFFGAHQGYNDSIDYTGGNRPAPIIQFINNVFMGTGDDNLDLDSTDAWVQGNIFLHVHKNGSPDTSSGVSGGNDDGNNGDVTLIGNIFYDCDQAVMAKQGNFYTLINNTIVRQTHQGGLDTQGAVLCLQDNNMAEGSGMYLEGNIMYDVENLTRNVTNGVVTFLDNLMALPWSGPGTGNSTVDPALTYIPRLDETYFTNWAEAQVMKQWFKPRAGSPAIGSGPDGQDRGALIPFGVSISGEPQGTTSEQQATLMVGVNRKGFSIPPSDWPNGAGYTHYRYRLDTNDWTAEIPIAVPITLTNLADGPHHVEVIGKNDAGMYQNDSAYGNNANVTISHSWIVQTALRISSIQRSAEGVLIEFPISPGSAYAVQYCNSLNAGPEWLTLTNVPPQLSAGTLSVSDGTLNSQTRFYRVIKN